MAVFGSYQESSVEHTNVCKQHHLSLFSPSKSSEVKASYSTKTPSCFFSPRRELIHFLSISGEALFVRITAGGKGNRSSVFLSFVTWGDPVQDSAVGKKRESNC